MNVIALDTEGPIFDDKEKWKGNAYGDPNDLVCFSWAVDDFTEAEQWDKDSPAYIQKLMEKNDLVVFFNGKHDIGWLRRYGVDFSNVRVWDVQLGEFVLGRQLNKFPSLDDTCVKYDIPKKLDVVKTEYWDKGIDNKDVPWPILSEYAAHDTAITLLCYHEQIKRMTPAQRKLVSLMSQDMLVLQEMEQNGITFDEEMCAVKSAQLDDEISEIKTKLSKVYPLVPINFNSGDQLSAFLFGGKVVEDIKVPDGVFKTGAKKGLPKLKNGTIEHVLPQLFTKSDKLQKEGVYETNEPALRKVKALAKGFHWVVTDLLRLAKLEKLNGTYYQGLPKLNKEMQWPNGKLHGQINQTLAVSGRLSSSKPNQQNFASELQDIFVSDY